MRTIQFTPFEVEALRHRLDQGDVIAEVFADTDGLQHLAPGAHAKANELTCLIDSRWTLEIDAADELSREVLVEAIEGSTWIACHDNSEVSPQRRAAAWRALQGAAEKVAQAFGLDPIALPSA